MRRIHLLRQALMMAVVLQAWLLLGGEPWIDSAWNKWTEKDVSKILTNSPWTQPAYVPYHPLRSGEDLETAPATIRVGHVEDANPMESHPVFRPDQVFLIRWESAKIVRSALHRSAELGLSYTKHGSLQPEDPEKAAKEYVITVLADHLNQLPPATESRLKENTKLTFHTSGRQLSPARVVVRYAHNFESPEAFEFYFDRTGETDQELSEEHRIDFRAQVGPRVFQARFNPAKMSTRRGRDF